MPTSSQSPSYHLDHRRSSSPAPPASASNSSDGSHSQRYSSRGTGGVGLIARIAQPFWPASRPPSPHTSNGRASDTTSQSTSSQSL